MRTKCVLDMHHFHEESSFWKGKVARLLTLLIRGVVTSMRRHAFRGRTKTRDKELAR